MIEISRGRYKILKKKLTFRATVCLPADVLWGSFVTHSFLPYGPWGRNECVTNEPQRTSAGRLCYSNSNQSFEPSTMGSKNLDFPVIVDLI